MNFWSEYFCKYNDRKLLLTFSIGKVVIKSVFLMPFRLVTSKHQQIPEVDSDCNRYCQPSKEDGYPTFFISKGGKWKIMAASSINSVPNSIIHGKTKPRSFSSRNTGAISFASHCLWGTGLLRIPGSTLAHWLGFKNNYLKRKISHSFLWSHECFKGQRRGQWVLLHPKHLHCFIYWDFV